MVVTTGIVIGPEVPCRFGTASTTNTLDFSYKIGIHISTLETKVQ